VFIEVEPILFLYMMNEPLNVNVKFVQIARMLLFKKKIKVSCAIEPLVGITSQECRTVRRLVMSVGITLY
jgi:hypothetical protein